LSTAVVRRIKDVYTYIIYSVLSLCVSQITMAAVWLLLLPLLFVLSSQSVDGFTYDTRK